VRSSEVCHRLGPQLLHCCCYIAGRCHEIPHRAHRVHRAHRTASRLAPRVTGRFAPSSVLPLHLFNVLLILLLIQLKPKHHRLDVLTIFQRGVRGARGAVFRDTPSQVGLSHVHYSSTDRFMLTTFTDSGKQCLPVDCRSLVSAAFRVLIFS